jgi:hypothetical protein
MKTPRIEGTMFTGDFISTDEFIDKHEAAFMPEGKEWI